MTRKWSFKTRTATISACRGASCKRSSAKTLFPASCFVPPVSLLCGRRSPTASVVSTFFPFIHFQPATLVSSRQTLKLDWITGLHSLLTKIGRTTEKPAKKRKKKISQIEVCFIKKSINVLLFWHFPHKRATFQSVLSRDEITAKRV